MKGESHDVAQVPIQVVCAGILVADCVARPVRDLPGKGQLTLVGEIALHLGGSAANTGVQLTRLGVQVALAGRVGHDSFGEFMRGGLERAGLDVTDVLVDDRAPTSATLVQVDADGERSFLHSIGANAHLSAADFALERWRAQGATLLHVAGIHILPGLEPHLAGVFARATQVGLVTSLDCVWDASGRWTAVREALPQTDLFCPSLSEAQGITGEQEPRAAAERLFDLGVRQAVALKMGERGSLVQARGEAPLFINAPRVTAVDGTGAGDSFIAGFLAAYLRGLAWADAARLGNAAGGLCASVMGGTNGLTDFPDTWALAQTLQARQTLQERTEV